MNTAALVQDLEPLNDPDLLRLAESAEQLMTYIQLLKDVYLSKFLASGVEPEFLAEQLDTLITRMSVDEIRNSIRAQRLEEIDRVVEEMGDEGLEEVMKAVDSLHEASSQSFRASRIARRELIKLRQNSQFPLYPIETTDGETTFHKKLMKEGFPYIVEVGDVHFVAVRTGEALDLYHLPDPAEGD